MSKRSPVIESRDECVQCGESKGAVRESQRRKDPLFCATVDYYGECTDDWDRHKFTWTEADQAAQAAEDAHWDAMALAIEAQVSTNHTTGTL